MNEDRCVLCKKNYADMEYAVDPERPKPLCGACFGRWSPRKLDALLGVRQADYGIEAVVLLLAPVALFAFGRALAVMA